MIVYNVNQDAVDTYVTQLSQSMGQAYGIFIGESLSATLTARYYTLSKWLTILLPGTYMIRLSGHQLVDMFIREEYVGTASAYEISEYPLIVTEPEVFRIDLQYSVTTNGAQGFALYQILNDKNVTVGISAAEGVTGTITPTAAELPADKLLGDKPKLVADKRFNYPPWLIKPNWSSSISDTLSWLTDVMISETGAEQRRKLRQYPRRSIEASFLRADIEASTISNTIGGAGSELVLIPLWWDAVRTDTAAEAGVTNVIAGNFTGREFKTGDLAIIQQDGFFEYELVKLVGVTENAVVVQGTVQVDAPKGSTITPVVSGRIENGSELNQLSSRVIDTRIRFNQDPPCVSEGELIGEVYNETGHIVFDDRFNWGSQQTLDLSRNVYTVDNGISPAYILDPSRESYGRVRRTYHLMSREEQDTFNRSMYAFSGRLKVVHLPSQRDDLKITADIDPSTGAIIVERCGYTQFQCATLSNYKYLALDKNDGSTIYCTIIASRVIDGQEWLYLSETIGNHAASSIRRIQFMPLARLDIDDIERVRLTDDKVTVALTFKLFDDRRK